MQVTLSASAVNLCRRCYLYIPDSRYSIPVFGDSPVVFLCLDIPVLFPTFRYPLNLTQTSQYCMYMNCLVYGLSDALKIACSTFFDSVSAKLKGKTGQQALSSLSRKPAAVSDDEEISDVEGQENDERYKDFKIQNTRYTRSLF